MSRFASIALKAVLVVFATPVLALAGATLAYDILVIRPRLPAIEEVLATASQQDADPPRLVRAYIDATGSRDIYAVRLVTHRFHPVRGQLAHSFHGALWQLLLPLHLDDARMYGLYATLAFNGTDHGLNRLAQREFGRPLDRLTPREAATVVAFTHAPQVYLRNRGWLEERATLLMERAASPAMQGGAIP